jgi:uncharacterized protein (DUF433 family)
MDADGTVRVGASRVTLDTVIAAFHEGYGAEEIAQHYSSVVLADAYATIAYYLHHRAEVDEYLTERRGEADVLRQESERRSSSQGVRERLLRRRRGA